MLRRAAVLASGCLIAGALGASAGWFSKGGKEKAEKAGTAAPAVDPFFEAHAGAAKSLAELPSPHAPVKEGRCSACHASPADPSKLLAEPKALCLSCHERQKAALEKASVHYPAREMGCATCHEPHGSENPRLLSQPGNGLCATCHDAADAGLKKKHAGVSSLSGRCYDCHDPHGSKHEKLIVEGVLHYPFEARSCEVCHREPGEGGRAKLQDPLSEACVMCHGEVAASLEAAAPHPPAASGECALCHDPHAAKRRGLVREPVASLCRQCHSEVPDLGHPTARHKSHEEGKADPSREGRDFTCASCHNPHGSEFGRILRGDGMMLCTACHKL